ncbi:MAG: PEP-CTERM sorting domain-containing protein [Planctomycetota bacterium]
MKMCSNKYVMLVMVIGFGLAAGANATMIDPSSLTATASSSHGTYPDPMVVVDGSGMAGDAHTYTWGSWFTAGADPDRWIVVALNGSYELDYMKVWNANEGWGWNVIGFDQTEVYVAYMADPGNPVDNAGNWTLITSQVLNQAPGVAGYDTPDTVDLLDTLGSHVALRSATVTGVYGDDRAGLSEIRIYEVPEPATLSLLGLGVFGLLRRKRS